MVKQHVGFTLIELMIVVAIVAILAAIAYPSYQEHVRRTKRVEMQSTLIDIAAQIQRHKIANFKVTGASMSDLGIASAYPLQGTPLYDVTLSPLSGTPAVLSNESWVLRATPKNSGSQLGTGAITLNYQNQKCWYKGKDVPQLTEVTKTDGTKVSPDTCTAW